MDQANEIRRRIYEIGYKTNCDLRLLKHFEVLTRELQKLRGGGDRSRLLRGCWLLSLSLGVVSAATTWYSLPLQHQLIRLVVQFFLLLYSVKTASYLDSNYA